MAVTARIVRRPPPPPPIAPDRLKFFSVSELFGEFDYKIPLNTDARVTAIIAPNGSGKTLCLRLITALFTKRWSFFVDIQFKRVDFAFESGARINISKITPKAEEDGLARLDISLSIFTPGDRKEFVWRPSTPDIRTARGGLERFVPFLTRKGISHYSHDYTGVVYTTLEVLDVFSEHIPPSIRSSFYGDEPKQLSDIIGGIDCHLIETQRLLILQDDADIITGIRQNRPRQSTLAISKKADTLRSVISKELTAYATLSQSLDRSFPHRVIKNYSRPISESLDFQLNDLDERRKKLTEAGILDAEADAPVSLPEGPMSPEIARVLSVYADDTLAKLDSLSKLLRRIELFRELINQRFTNKKIAVSRQAGFEVQTRNGLVPLEKLSSGEQHQLVLFFELLFELKGNALILIDEPELSLHVTWQKKFIADLNRIIKLNEFDVILATHSPQLVSHWEDLVVELGDVDEE